MSQPRPRSVTMAIWLLMALVALSALTALLSFILEDDLIDAWAADQPASSAVEPPSFVPVAVVLFIVVALLAGVLVMFFRDGLNWARISLSGLAVFMAAGALASLLAHPPALFVLIALVFVAVDVALIACLWHKDSRVYCTSPRAGADAPA